MKLKRFRLTAFFLLGFGLAGIHAQESINSSGGNATGSGGTVSYSVGQVDYIAQGNASGSVSQGVQQLFDISVVIGLEESETVSIDCSVFPNPSSEKLTLKMVESRHFNFQLMSFRLYNSNGILLLSNHISGNETVIDMSQLLPATYILKIMHDNKEVKTFKIIKNPAK